MEIKKWAETNFALLALMRTMFAFIKVILAFIITIEVLL
tara:strand:+ start:1752 stop:1868 length:117 start_codon:yes stop_codon:yes gene_type:complete